MNADLLTEFGCAAPLGAHCIDVASGCWNFAVYAPDASALSLCLFCPDTEEPLAELAFDARTGDIWHLQVRHIPPGSLYLLRADGPDQAAQGLTFEPRHLLIDPYARKLNRAVVFNERLYQSDSHYMLAKAVLSDHDDRTVP